MTIDAILEASSDVEASVQYLTDVEGGNRRLNHECVVDMVSLREHLNVVVKFMGVTIKEAFESFPVTCELLMNYARTVVCGQRKYYQVNQVFTSVEKKAYNDKVFGKYLN